MKLPQAKSNPGLRYLKDLWDERVVSSLDTALHGFLLFAHFGHLHPDWSTALAAAASDRTRCTTGHLIPVDGGLTEAFLR